MMANEWGNPAYAREILCSQIAERRMLNTVSKTDRVKSEIFIWEEGYKTYLETEIKKAAEVIDFMKKLPIKKLAKKKATTKKVPLKKPLTEKEAFTAEALQHAIDVTSQAPGHTLGLW